VPKRLSFAGPTKRQSPSTITVGMSLVATSEHGALSDLRRGVMSRRASLTGGGASVIDVDRPITMRAVSRRASLSGMALPPTTQSSPHVKKRPSRSKSTQRQPSDDKSVSSKQEKSSVKKGRGRSQSVHRSSKSTDKSKTSERKSPERSFEKKGRGRTSKSSDLPPETRASEKKGRGRSQSAHRSSKSSGNSESRSSGTVPPETQAPDKKAHARSKSTQQRRTCKTTKEQARRTYEFNKFDNDTASKCEAEDAEVAEKTKAAESALDRRRARSQSISHRRSSGLGKVASTPEVENQPLTANSSIQTENGSVHSKDVSTFGAKDSSGAGKSLALMDFPAPDWDDDPWADEEEFFNPKAPTATTKVEITPIVPADPSNLFRSDYTAAGSMSSHSRGNGTFDLGSAHSRGSGSSSGGRRRSSLTLTAHMGTSLGGKFSDAESVSGRSRISLQGIRRSHSSQSPTVSPGERVPPPTAADLFAKKLEEAKRLDQARSGSQRLLKVDSGQVLVAAENLEAANKLDAIRRISQRLIMADSGLDQARSGSQRPLKGDSGRGIAADSQVHVLCAELCEDAKKLYEIRKISQSPGKTNSGLDLGSIKRKPSNALQPTSASAFAAKLHAARQHDDSMSASDTVNTEPTASIRSTSSRRSSMSSGSSTSRLPRRQSTEMGHHSPRPDNSTSTRRLSMSSGRKQLRRGSSMV
jgi:hypothetical protein